MHWFSILNFRMAMSFVIGLMFIIFFGTIWRDPTKYIEEVDNVSQTQMTKELLKSMLVVWSVFCLSNNFSFSLWYVMDMQIVGMANTCIYVSRNFPSLVVEIFQC